MDPAPAFGMRSSRRISYDQLVKQLLVDVPLDALRFFGGAASRDLTKAVRITLLRQEQGSRRLGRGHRIVDALPLVEWPDGSRQARVFLIEQKLRPTREAVFQVAHYLLHVAQWLERDRGITEVVPVVIFVKDGKVRTRIELASKGVRYLTFDCVATRLAPMSAGKALRSGNLAAAANVMSMRYPRRQKAALCAQAVSLWRRRVRDDGLVGKYADHLFRCARMNRRERLQFRERLAREEGRAVRTPFDDIRDEGVQEGQAAAREAFKSALLEILTTQQVKLSPAERRRILSCKNLDRLRQWTVRAATARSAANLFVETRVPPRRAAVDAPLVARDSGGRRRTAAR